MINSYGNEILLCVPHGPYERIRKFRRGGRLKYRLEVADARTQIRTALTTLRMINDERRGAVSR